MNRGVPAVLISTAYDPAASNPQRWYAAWTASGYFDSVRLAAGVPLLAPPLDNPAEAAAAVAACQAVILSGGPDLDPSAWGAARHPATKLMHPRRNSSDLLLARAAWDSGKPLLAICGGMQALNVALGGSLHQHLPDAFPGLPGAEGSQRVPDDHMHAVSVTPGTRLAAILGASVVEVNSAHHQAVDRPAAGLDVSASSPAGVIEALEPTDRSRFALLVQWHPERLAIAPPVGDRGGRPIPGRPDQFAIFEALIRACG